VRYQAKEALHHRAVMDLQMRSQTWLQAHDVTAEWHVRESAVELVE